MSSHTAAISPHRLRAETRTPLAAACAMLALLLFASSAAQASVFRMRASNTWSGEEIGNNLRPAWNVPITGEEVTPPAAAPESTGPVAIHFDEDLTETTRAISDDFFDWLDVYVTGLSLGQSVVIERFLVDNDQGIINANAILMESHGMQTSLAKW